MTTGYQEAKDRSLRAEVDPLGSFSPRPLQLLHTFGAQFNPRSCALTTVSLGYILVVSYCIPVNTSCVCGAPDHTCSGRTGHCPDTVWRLNFARKGVILSTCSPLCSAHTCTRACTDVLPFRGYDFDPPTGELLAQLAQLELVTDIKSSLSSLSMLCVQTLLVLNKQLLFESFYLVIWWIFESFTFICRCRLSTVRPKLTPLRTHLTCTEYIVPDS